MKKRRLSLGYCLSDGVFKSIPVLNGIHMRVSCEISRAEGPLLVQAFSRVGQTVSRPKAVKEEKQGI